MANILVVPIFGKPANSILGDDGALEPGRFLDIKGEYIPYKTFYETILHKPQRDEHTSTCRNTNTQALGDFYYSRFDTYHFPVRESIGVAHELFYQARSSGILECICVLPSQVRQVIPRCQSWMAFEDWVVQLLACQYNRSGGHFGPQDSPSRTSFHSIVSSITSVLWLSKCIHPRKVVDGKNTNIDAEFIRWEESVDFEEVFRLLTWLRTSVNEFDLSYLVPRRGDRELREFDPLIVIASDRAEKMGLCQQRIWSLAQNTPAQELSLPILVPTASTNSPSRTIWRHGGHELCTPCLCQYSALDFTKVEQLHVCNAPKKCRQTKGLFPAKRLLAAIDKQMVSTDYIPTAWSLDGRSIVAPGHRFMAVSHVWSDGTGTGISPIGTVNVCLWDFFIKVARRLGCSGVWWDVVCLPTAKKQRITAINRMHENYNNAYVTLVHDCYLTSFQWTNAADASFAIIMSPWFTRGWTALELETSPLGNVKVLFRDEVLMDLDRDIMAQDGVPCHLYHLFATAIIKRLRRGEGRIRNWGLDGLLTALGPRYTSWTRDKAIIAGLLAGIDDPAAMTQQEAYQTTLRRLGFISFGNLLHGMPMTRKVDFHWCPTDILKMPPAADRVKLQVQANGNLVGMLSVHCLSKAKAHVTLLSDTHPLIRARLQSALLNARTHLLLTITDYPGGLVVRLRSGGVHVGLNTAGFEAVLVCCELVGPVFLNQPQRWGIGHFEVTIGDGRHQPELPATTSACSALFELSQYGDKAEKCSC